MLAATVTLALFAFILTLVVDLLRRDGGKIVAALEGRSWIAQPRAGRPVTIQFSPAGMVAELAPPPALRAAA